MYAAVVHKFIVGASFSVGVELGRHPRQQLLRRIFDEGDRSKQIDLIQQFLDEAPIIIHDLRAFIQATIRGDIEACPRE